MAEAEAEAAGRRRRSRRVRGLPPAAAEAEAEPGRRAGGALRWLAAYSACNLGLAMVNQYSVAQESVHVPLLLLLQTFATSTYTLHGCNLPLREAFTPRKVALVAPLSLLYSLQHQTRLHGMKLTSQTSVIVARQLVPLLVAGAEAVLFRKRKDPRSVACLLLIFLGVVAYGSQLPEALPGAGARGAGALSVAAHLAATATAILYGKAISVRIRPRELTFLVNSFTFPLFLALCAFSEARGEGRVRQMLLESPALAKAVVVLSLPLATCISIAQSEVQLRVSGTTFAVTGNVLKVATIGVSIALGQKPPVGLVSWGGLTVAMGGGFLYILGLEEKRAAKKAA